MNKTAIKTFAIWARNKLIDDITYKAGLLGITDKEIKTPLPQSSSTVQFFDNGTKEPYAITGNDVEQRRKLVEALMGKDSDHPTAFKNLVEEVAYTWFNRLIAVRFMEVNDYLPTRIRVLSSESPGKREPDLVTHPFDAELDYSQSERQQIAHLQENNRWDELFRMLFIKQCNALNAVLPELFEKTNDYTELLMNVSFTDQDGVVFHLVNDIDEEDFNVEKEGQVEIIGWLYQYYISEPKDVLINARSKYKKQDIPFVTQLFTSDWIVRYMVENSLGRLWLEGHPNESLKTDWKYFLDEAEQELEGQKQLDEIREEYKKIRPEEIRVLDPCMGSGHILVYAFDVLMAIYESNGYSQRDAAKSILENNLFGLDIDTRAYQLAYFALMMKARQYNRRILNGETRCNVYTIEESNSINREHLKYFGKRLSETEHKTVVEQIENLLDTFIDAREYGSILNVAEMDWKILDRFVENSDAEGQITFGSFGIDETQRKLKLILKIAEIMAKKYEVVITNPPYMNSSYMTDNLKSFIGKEYKSFKSDTFSVFIKKCMVYCKENGQIGMLTPYVWMFINSYEELRKYILKHSTITSLVQLEYNAFEAACVPVAAFTLRNKKTICTGEYIKLSDFRGIDVQAPKTIKAVEDRNCGYRYSGNQENFSKIPGMPIAYWASENAIKIYEDSKPFEKIGTTRAGMITGNNHLFVRLWYEIPFIHMGLGMKNRQDAIKSKRKWFPYNKGGEFRKWFGNNEYVVNWENDGYYMRNFKDATGKVPAHAFNLDFIFKENVTWNSLTSYKYSARYTDYGFLYDASGSFADIETKDLYYSIGFLCSEVSAFYLSLVNPTLNFQKGNISTLPIIISTSEKTIVNKIVLNNISISKTDWDSFETSWDFKTHPLLDFRSDTDLGVIRTYEQDENGHLVDTETILVNGGILTAFERWQDFTELQFTQLKQNEEELNRIFIDIYGLQDELTPEVEDKDVTIRRADLGREIRSFISYAVGCMFGRYSLDTQGLAYAGGEWDSEKYQTFIPDQDNVLPITDEEYFEDDVVGLFVAFVKKVYGEATLEDNLDFIAGALGNKGNTSREIIRNYFLKDFFKDHCKVYQKRPIYWLFDSGKENGFKALIYLHRYNADTIGNLRIDYLHRMQKVYESEMARMQETIDNSTNPRDVSAATKRKEKLIKQLKETKEYDEKIAHLALARIDLDLDDGVKVNYEKVQTDVEGRKLAVLAKI